MDDAALGDLQQRAAERLGDTLLSHQIAVGELTLAVEAGAIATVLTTLRDDPHHMYMAYLDIHDEPFDVYPAVEWP